MKLTFILVLAAFLGVVVVVYFGVWVPFEKQLNQTIYKTKNMLCIIPKEVLASLTNIHKLLDIGQTFNKASNRMMQQK
jgi:ABC-type proline/glycine betaine transport system permease subunit